MAPGLSRSTWAMSFLMSGDRRTNRVAIEPTIPVGHDAPPWGVARKITRRTLGAGSK